MCRIHGFFFNSAWDSIETERQTVSVTVVVRIVRHEIIYEIEYGLIEIVVCDEIDLCLPEFYRDALKIFKEGGAEMVIGSKRAKGANDQRPFGRRFATFILNMMLKVLLGLKGTDTHGVKAFVKAPLMPVMDKCLVGKDIFASEFVIRAERAGIKIAEVPVSLDEKRAPSINLIKRVPKVLSNLAYLFWNIRIKKD